MRAATRRCAKDRRSDGVSMGVVSASTSTPLCSATSMPASSRRGRTRRPAVCVRFFDDTPRQIFRHRENCALLDRVREAS